MVRSLSVESESEIERVCRNSEFFQSRFGSYGNVNVEFFNPKNETIVADGISLKEMSKRRLNNER